MHSDAYVPREGNLSKHESINSFNLKSIIINITINRTHNFQNNTESYYQEYIQKSNHQLDLVYPEIHPLSAKSLNSILDILYLIILPLGRSVIVHLHLILVMILSLGNFSISSAACILTAVGRTSDFLIIRRAVLSISCCANSSLLLTSLRAILLR